MQRWFWHLLNTSHVSFSSLEGIFIFGEVYVSGNKIRADVLDFDNTEYVVITFKPFTKDELAKLRQIINDDDVKHQIALHKVPQVLFDSEVQIFPKSLDDLSVECSCLNDSCTHVFRVLYELYQMIKEDPFLIFSLRGLDLENVINVPIKSIEEIFTNNYKSSGNGELNNLFDVNMFFLNDEKHSLDYLKDIYCQLFNDLIDDIKILKFTSQLYKRSITLNIDFDYKINNIGKVKDELSLFKYILALDDSKSFWCDLFDLTLMLLKHYAIMPELFELKENKFAIRWIPSFFDSNVVAFTQKYYDKCPEDLITFNKEKLSKENQVIIAISLIFKGFIKYHFENFGFNNYKSIFPPLMFELFFDEFFELKSYHKMNVIYDVASKLLVYHNTEQPISFLISFEKSIEKFKADLKVKRDDGIFDIEDARFDDFIYARSIYRLLSNNSFNVREFEPIIMSRKDYFEFDEIIPLLEYANVECDIPFEIHKSDVKLKLDVEISDDTFTLNDLDEFSWKVNIGSEDIPIDEFNKISKNPNGFLEINDKFYAVDNVKFKSFKSDILFLPKDFSGFEILQIALLGKYRNLKFQINDEFRDALNISSDYDVPDNLEGELRNYQKKGFSWLVQNIKSGFGSILADDMGLGKTIQVLTLILYLKNTNQLTSSVLIICPTTLISNWENEIKKFTPSLTYSVFHGSQRDEIDTDVDMILTSFGIVRKDLDKFLKRNWMICVVDEAQNIKNPSTKQTKAVKSINALNHIALTGTPIENRLMDYWSIFDFTNPNYLSNRNDFKNKYVQPIEKNNSKVLDNLKKITKPFILRRLKTDKNIIKELPEKNVNDIYCSLTDKQQKLYDKVLNKEFDSLKDTTGVGRRGGILKLLTYLKQICNHPAHFKKSKNLNAKQSGKSELLMDILENILEAGEKVIIFTQYVQMGEILKKLILKRFNREVLFLHGSLSREERDVLIDNFQNEVAYPILIATLKTGGVGLNLTAAQNVIHYDLWWNPAVENQATDRVYRIGQKNDVMVYRFITKGTLEEKIDLMIKEKLELAGKAIDSQETFITEMSDEELLEMLSLRL